MPGLCPTPVKTFLMATAVLLVAAGCSGAEDVGEGDSAKPPPAATTSATPSAQPLTVARVATLRAESRVHGLALCGRHLAYVQDTSQVVLADWRSGTSRTVFSTDHSFLYAERQVGCRLEVFDTANGYNGEDPSEPGRTLTIDLRTGDVWERLAAPHAPSLVGRDGTRRTVELVSGVSWRSLVLADPSGIELLSGTGEVVSAAMSGHHVVWTDGPRSQLSDSVYSVDIRVPDAPVRIAYGGNPVAVAVADEFLAWTDGPRQYVAAVGGGSAVTVPGPQASSVLLAADGDLLARVIGRNGDLIELLRVDV